MQSIIENSMQEVSKDLSSKLIEDAEKELLNIRFSVGKGVANLDKFKTLFLKNLFCNTPCGLTSKELDRYLDTLRNDLITYKEEYL